VVGQCGVEHAGGAGGLAEAVERPHLHSPVAGLAGHGQRLPVVVDGLLRLTEAGVRQA
jgi:hypothetical protein